MEPDRTYPLPPPEHRRVTVVIPTFNRKQSLRRCLQALFACDVAGLEVDVRVVDDGSTDGTGTAVEALQAASPAGFRLHYHVQPRGGPSAARNLGVEAADTDLILFTDDDCAPNRRWIRSLVEEVWDTGVGVAVGRIVSQQGSSWTSRYCHFIHYNEFPCSAGRLRHIGFANTANCAFLREAIREADGFDMLFSRVGYEDVDLSRRVMLLGYPLTYVPGAVVRHFHREDVPALWRAFWKRGYASSLLDTSWHSAAGASWQALGGELGRLLLQCAALLRVPLDARVHSSGASWREAVCFAWLDWLCELARGAGSVAMTYRIVSGRQSLARSCRFEVPEEGLHAALRRARRRQRQWLGHERVGSPGEEDPIPSTQAVG